jgi:hypothetical protein
LLGNRNPREREMLWNSSVRKKREMLGNRYVIRKKQILGAECCCKEYGNAG